METGNQDISEYDVVAPSDASTASTEPNSPFGAELRRKSKQLSKKEILNDLAASSPPASTTPRPKIKPISVENPDSPHDDLGFGDIVAVSSYSPASAASDVASPLPSSPPDRQLSEKAIAPEPPRWRFVNEARKSLGYSSASAGHIVQGHSSDELGAKYTAPDVSLYKPAKEQASVKKGEFALPTSKRFTKDDTEVGVLDGNVPQQGAFSNENNEVGKLVMQGDDYNENQKDSEVGKLRMKGDDPNESNSPSGTFAGLPKRDAQGEESRNPFKKWGVNLGLSPKNERENEWYSGKIDDTYTMPGETELTRTHRGVGRLGFHRPGEGGESFDGTFPRGANGSVASSELRGGALYPDRSDSSKNVVGDFTNASLHDSKKEKKKRRWLYLLLLLLLLLVLILAVLMGTKDDGEEAAAMAAAGALIPPVADVNETSVPSSSSYPTASPSSLQNAAPTLPVELVTDPPTPEPTPKCSTEQDFNLCLAVDMSGSVCNSGSGSECTGCEDSFLDSIFSMFFEPECRDSFVSADTCCGNFDNVKQFSSLIVGALADFDAEKSFSVVQFATNAQLVSSLSSGVQTMSVINQLDYTGGLTNHQAAIQACQGSLQSFDSRKNFILLVTDGVPTVGSVAADVAAAEGAAEAAATSAKSAGTHIIPVFISPNGNDVSALNYMRRLSSDGKVFDVFDFASLNSLQDRLIDEVSCS